MVLVISSRRGSPSPTPRWPDAPRVVSASVPPPPSGGSRNGKWGKMGGHTYSSTYIQRGIRYLDRSVNVMDKLLDAPGGRRSIGEELPIGRHGGGEPPIWINTRDVDGGDICNGFKLLHHLAPCPSD